MPGTINAPLLPVTESSLPAIWWLSQLQNPLSEILGPLLVPSVAGWVLWHLVSDIKFCIKVEKSPWDQSIRTGAEASRIWQKKLGSNGVTMVQSILGSGAGMTHQNCPTLGRGCWACGPHSYYCDVWAAPSKGVCIWVRLVFLDEDHSHRGISQEL